MHFLDPVAKRFPYGAGGDIDRGTLATYKSTIPYADGYDTKQRAALVNGTERLIKSIDKALQKIVGGGVVTKSVWTYADLEAAGLLRNVCGINVILDRPVGTVQSGVGTDGQPWSRTYTCDYGFIPDTISPDGEEFDVYVGTCSDATNAYIITQTNQDGSYDEPKLMLCFGSAEEAIAAFLAHMPSWALGGMSAMPVHVIANLLNIDAPIAMSTVRKAACGGAKKAVYKSRKSAVAKGLNNVVVSTVITAERCDGGVDSWVVTNVLGEHSQCTIDVFREMYEPMNELAKQSWSSVYDDEDDEDEDPESSQKDIDFSPPDSVREAARRGLDAKAEWSTAEVNDLPDSAFLYIAPGGEKDDAGKTVPRTLRYFPVYDATSKLDLPHLRNALARIGQANIPQEAKDAARDKAEQLLKDATESAKSNAVAKGVCFDNRKSVALLQLSFDQVRDMLGNALGKLYNPPQSTDPCVPCTSHVWVTDVYNDCAVYSLNGDLWCVGYTIDVASVTLSLVGEPQRVMRTYAFVATNQPIMMVDITTSVATPALQQTTQVGAQPTPSVQDLFGRPMILLMRDSGISGEVAVRAVEAMRKLHAMPPELAASFKRMVRAWDGVSMTNKTSVKAIDDVPDLANHPARTMPLTDRYNNPDNVGGWLGYIEPPSGEWIAFVTTSGEALLWTMREPDGGVIGDPVMFQRPDLIAPTSAPSPAVLPVDKTTPPTDEQRALYQDTTTKALPIPVQIIEPAPSKPVVEPYTAFDTWDDVVKVLRACGRSGDDVADIIKSLRLPLDERKRALMTAHAFDSVLRWDGNVVPFRKVGQAEHPAVTAPLEMMFASPEEMGGWIGWIEPKDQKWFALVDAEGKTRVWLMREACGSVCGPAYELKRKDLGAPQLDVPNEKSDERFDKLHEYLKTNPPTFARNGDGSIFTAKANDNAPKGKRLVYAVVLEPHPNDGSGDAQQHTYDEEFCEEACHYFARFQILKDNHGTQGVILPKDRIYVAQNYIAPCEMMLGSQMVKQGSWVMVVCIPDDELWAKVERGEWNAFSIEGHSTHTQIAA